MNRVTSNVLAILTLLAAGHSGACAAPNARIHGDIVYGHKYGMALTMDVFVPDEKPNGAGIIYLVSGGWISHWRPPDKTVRRFAAHLKKGFTVFVVRHGSSPKFNIPEIVSDVRRAVRFVRLHAREYGVDPKRLGICGASAGGHLALLIGTASDKGDPAARDKVLATSDRVAAVVAYFAPVDLRPMNVDPDDLNKNGPGPRQVFAKAFPALVFESDQAEAMSPIVHVTPDDPPTLLIHGDKDWLVPLLSSQSIHEALEKNGVPTDLLIIEGAGHGFRGGDAGRARDALLAWFEKYLLAEK